MGIGIILVIAALILAVWAGTMDVTSYNFDAELSKTLDADKLATQALITLAAEAAFGLGVVLWLAGYIVSAISFLPGTVDAQD